VDAEAQDMIESEWRACMTPEAKLKYMRRNASARKLRLFAVASCRRIWHLLADDTLRKALEAIEGYADGIISTRTIDTWRRKVFKTFDVNSEPRRWTAWHSAVRGVAYSLFPTDLDNTVAGAGWAADALATEKCPGSKQRGSAPFRKVFHSALEHLLGEIFGNPISPSPIEPFCRTPTVKALAKEVYEKRSLPEGVFDPIIVAVLADALEDAGCTDADILNHLRGPGPHARGCHVIDALLGRT
jgi:hypothetical protein